MAPPLTSPSANVTADANFWPEPFTVHRPHQHSRVFIGPFPHANARTAHGAPAGTGHERYLSNEVEEGDDYHVKGRKRDVVRRQKRKVLQRRRRASSASAWGDDDGGAESSSSGSSFSEGGRHADDPDGRTSRRPLRRRRRRGHTTDPGTATDTDADGGADGRPPRRLKRWVQDARGGRAEQGALAGAAAASTGDGLPSSTLHGKQVSASVAVGVAAPSAEEEELVNTIMAPVRDEDVSEAPADRGWWKVRWEGDRRRMSVSSSINGFTMPPPPLAPTLASAAAAKKRRNSIATTTIAGISSALGFNQHSLRGGLNASSSTGSTTLASKSRLLPVLKIAPDASANTVAGPGSRPRPYLLDPRNQLPPPPSPASYMSVPKRPSRQGSRSSERSIDTFYSARTDLGPPPTPGSTRPSFQSNGLIDSPPPSDDEGDVRLRTGSGLSSQCFPSSTTSVDAPVGPPAASRPKLPQIVHTEASPNASASSSFVAHPTPLPIVAAVSATVAATVGAPAPLRSAMRRPTQPILKGPLASTPPNLLQTVHFPPTTGPTPSIGKRLVTDLRARGAGPGGGGLRSTIALEDRAEVIGSSGGERTATFGHVSGDDEPAPPEEVLNREGGTGVEGDGGPMTAIPYEHDEDFKVGDVILRDRMLVKKQWSRSSGLPPGYNEQTQRKIPVDRSEAWEERLVVLKKGRVEIYDDWGLPFRERLVGVKKLIHVIYLQKETSLSLYSNTDLTFCLLTPPTSLKDARSTRSSSGIKSRMPRITRSGTSIFIFKIKSRTRAIDWMWELYIQLRGPQALPRYLDVHVPAFNNARVRLRVPVVGEDPGFDSLESVLRRLTRKQVIKHCARILSDVEGFRSLLVECGALSATDLEHGVVRGDDVDKHLALAWRHGDRLDWIWADDDVLQQSRDWNVLAGAGPLQSLTQPAKLELRLARHTASILHLKSGTRVTEPPAVEGYLHRIRPKTGAKTLTYLTVHDGCIFICSPIKAHTPAPPPGLEVDDAGEKSRIEHDRPTTEAAFKRGERIRAIQQILSSNGFLDFRDIASVARATTEHVRRPRPASKSSSSRRRGLAIDDDDDDDDEEDDGWESLSDDERDLGGDEGLKSVEDQKTLQERRQIVVRLVNGDSFVFEAHSALVAREWIDRLNSLRIYWTEKHLEEALQEMEVSRSTRIRLPAGLMGTKQRQWDSDDELEDPDDPPAYIEDFCEWNWCVLDACRPIVKAGRLFSKRRHWQFRAKYNILVHGHLVQFSLDLDRPIHTRSHRFFLIDAYVYTGYLAQEGLPPSSNEAAYLGKGEPRRYADGFQTDDGSEDTVLVIWYRPHFVTTDKDKYIARAQQDSQYVPPALGNSGHQKLVLRARSKLERDAWANALNLEIERLARRRKDREDRIRSTGNVL